MNLIQTALQQLKSTDYEASLNLILRHKDCSRLIRVKFAYHCANDCFLATDWKGIEEAKELSKRSLELVAKWLANSNSVSEAELEKFVNSDSYIIFRRYTSKPAIKSACSAIDTANSNDYFYLPNNSIPQYFSASYAVNSAIYSTYGFVNKKEVLKKYFNYLVDLILSDYKGTDKATLELLYK